MNTERSRDFQLSSAIVIGVTQIMKIRSLSIIPLLWSFTFFGLAPMGHAVGPGSSVEISQDSQKTHRYADLKTNTRLNVIVPVFDPNFPEDPDDYEKQGIWPEVRNTEAKLFALRLRDTLQDSGAFGAVRVTPTDEAVGDLYVTGRILQSTSEIVKIEISVQDISQKLWFRSPQKFEHRVREYQLASARTKDEDPYAPIYAEITQAIVERLAKFKERELVRIQDTASLVLARSYSEETFGPYLTTRKGTVRPRELPAANDPKYQRALRLKAREEVFIDELQDHYQLFAGTVQESYLTWQRDSFPEAKEYRLEAAKARRQRRLGIISAVAGAVLATQAGESDAARAGAIAGGVVGGGLIYQSFKTRADSKIHLEQLTVNGQTLDLELAPKNIEFEGKTAELSGTAKEQFQQHREYLKRWYEDEATPNVQL